MSTKSCDPNCRADKWTTIQLPTLGQYLSYKLNSPLTRQSWNSFDHCEHERCQVQVVFMSSCTVHTGNQRSSRSTQFGFPDANKEGRLQEVQSCAEWSINAVKRFTAILSSDFRQLCFPSAWHQNVPKCSTMPTQAKLQCSSYCCQSVRDDMGWPMGRYQVHVLEMPYRTSSARSCEQCPARQKSGVNERTETSGLRAPETNMDTQLGQLRILACFTPIWSKTWFYSWNQD